MNPNELFSRFRSMVQTLTTGQLTTLVVAFVAVVGVVIGAAYWVNTPTFAVLFSDLDAESAGAVVEKLKAANVSYVIDDGGRTVRVPDTRLNELRLEFASEGLPASGRIGFEIFDRTSFGVTDFMEHVNYRRALEGELARTISSIAEVAGARVHIAIPQPSLFVGQEQPAKASVVLRLRNSRQIGPQTVNAITSLVAASVESLKPEAVVVIDNFGRPLARMIDSSNELGSQEQLERQQRIERNLSTRVVALLEPVVGPGRARVNVSAQISAGMEEQTEERWDPSGVIRSQQTVNQSAAGLAPVQGVSGARANLPPDQSGQPIEQPPPNPLSAPPAAGSVQVSQTTNYEIGKLITHRVEPSGRVARLSVAVVLDDARRTGGDDGSPTTQPRSAEEIQKIYDLVAASVGFDPARGDQLTVENIAFEDLSVDAGEGTPEARPWWKLEPEILELVRIGGVMVIALIALFGVIRPMVKRSVGGLPAGARRGDGVQVPRRVQELENEIEAKLQAGENVRALPILTKRAAALTQNEPENAARLLRAWLSEEPR